MAITRLPLKPTYGLGQVDATITNPKNNKSVKLPLEFDTGTPFTALENRYARTLGLDWDEGRPIDNDQSHLFRLLFKVGTLKPFPTNVEVFTSKTNIPYNTIGYYTIKQFKRISYNSKSIIFEDNNPGVNVNMLRLFATYISGTRTEKREDYSNIYYYHPVTFFNKKTGAPITIEMEVDTGTEYPTLPAKYAKRLGIDDLGKGAIDISTTSSLYGDYGSYIHRFTIQIGKLKPVMSRVEFLDKDNQRPLLGLGDIIKKVRVDITGHQLKYTELAALAEAHKSFYGYPRWHTKRI